MPSTIPLPSSFLLKKQKILTALSASTSPSYTDKSPKGSIDAEIIDLIDEINGLEGYVTTSSCAGRISVFVEGGGGDGDESDEDEDGSGDWEGDEESEDLVGVDDHDNQTTKTTTTTPTTNVQTALRFSAKTRTRRAVEPTEAAVTTKTKTKPRTRTKTKTKAGPGGKGHGNHWLLVSHTPLTLPPPPSLPPQTLTPSRIYHDICQLQPPTPALSTSSTTSVHTSTPVPRLRFIHLSFSPLILHVLCASLRHAKPLLAAAINAGFRESGVQSLKALDDGDRSGVMVAIRTAGVAFESVVGYIEDGSTSARADETMEENGNENRNGNGEDEDESEIDKTEKKEYGVVYRSILPDEALGLLLCAANERFEWNRGRKERLRDEIARMQGRVVKRAEEEKEWEDQGVRMARKREEGRRRQLVVRGVEGGEMMRRRTSVDVDAVDVLQDGLGLDVLS